jgi:hypothetical protein
MCEDVLDAHLDPLLDKILEAHKDQRDEVAPGPSIIFRSLKKLHNGLKRFSQGGKPLVRYRQLLRQIFNSFHSLHKISVSSLPNQPGKGKILFGSSSYLLNPVVVVENRNLHLLDIFQEHLFIPLESWSKQQIKANTKVEDTKA